MATTTKRDHEGHMLVVNTFKDSIGGVSTMKDGLSRLLAKLQAMKLHQMSSSNDFSGTGSPTKSRHLEYEREITDLTHQLCFKIEEYSDLLHPNSDNADGPGERGPNYSLSPIARCPDVLLGYIFEYMAEAGSHNIRPLLTVNKRFHELAMSNPLLWRKIFIAVDRNLEEANSLTAQYVRICLERSKDVLLDVILDRTNVCPPQDLVRRCILDAVTKHLVNEDDRKEITSYIRDAFDETEEDPNFPFWERKADKLSDIIRSLTGPKYINTRRWRSAILSFPSTEFATSKRWSMFSVEMPNLQSLHINGLDFEALDGALPDSAWSKVTQFTFDEPIELRKAPLEFANLTALEFYSNDNTLSNMGTLVYCVSLRELSIHIGKKAHNRNAPRIHVHLPLLTSLSLKGEVDAVAYVRFQLPRLEIWRLRSSSTTRHFPVVDALHVECDFWSEVATEYEMDSISRLLSGFKKTETLTVKGLKYPDACLTMLRGMKVAKKLPANLKLVKLDDRAPLKL